MPRSFRSNTKSRISPTAIGSMPGKGSSSKKVLRIGREAARDLAPAALTARKGDRRRAAEVGDGELVQKLLQPFPALCPVLFNNLKDREDIVLDVQSLENRALLRKIANSHLCAAVHGKGGHVASIDGNLPAVGHDKSGDGVEARRLARAVRSQQRHYLAPVQLEADVPDDGPSLVGLPQVPDLQALVAVRYGKRWRGHQFPPGVKTVRTRPSIRPEPAFRSRVSDSPAMAFWPCVRITSPDRRTVPSATE